MKRMFLRRLARCGGGVALAAAAAASPALGATSDPAGDFLGTYAGPQNADLDILGVGAFFDGSQIALTANLAGAAFATPNSLLAWGINRGSGTARFQFMGAPPPVGASVLFDALYVQFANGTGRIVVFNPMAPPSITPVPGGAVTGNSITGFAPLALLPSTGFAAADYTFTLWTRRRINAAFDTNNTEIADFAPTIAAAVPEPASWVLLILGFGAIGAGMRRRLLPKPSRACGSAA